MKKTLTVLALVSVVAGAQARYNNNHMNNAQGQNTQNHKRMMHKNKAEKMSFDVVIDNTKSNKPSVITLNYANTPRYKTYTVKAHSKKQVTITGYMINNIGVRQGRGPASTKEKDAFRKPIKHNYTITIMSDNTPGGFSVRFGNGNGNGNNKGFFGMFRK